MKFTPEKIVKIVNSKSCYSIPIYQRLFEWNDKNVGTLLDDLWHAYDEGRHADDEETNNYYIGMLTTTSENELVDGQQRFVVMMLLGCVLKKYYSNWVKFIFTDNDLRLKFPSRPDDEEHLRHIFSLKNPDKTDKTKMGKAVWRIYNFLEGKTDDEKKKFAEYVFNHLSFFISELPESYKPVDLNKYFERMNTTGKNLEPHEILKVWLLRDLEDAHSYMCLWNELADVDDLFFDRLFDKDSKIKKGKIKHFLAKKTEVFAEALNGNIDQLLDKAKSEKSNQEDSTRISEITPSEQKPDGASSTSESGSPLTFPQLLLQALYWYLKKNSDVKVIFESFFDPKNLIETFEKYLPKPKALDFFKTLVKCRLALDFCFVRSTGGGYSLDMNFSDEEESESEEKKRLRMFESMLLVSSARSTNYRWFSCLMDFIDSEDYKAPEPLKKNLKPQKLLECLQEMDNGCHKLFTDNASDDDLLKKLSYDEIRNDHYWFWRLDYYLWETRANWYGDLRPEEKDAVNGYVFRNYSSIEHLHPQNQSEQTDEWKDDDIHSFGNLALISSSFNSEQSNDYLYSKLARIKKQIDKRELQSLKLLRMYIAAVGATTWSPDIMKPHQKEMIEILEDSFNPSSNS